MSRRDELDWAMLQCRCEWEIARRGSAHEKAGWSVSSWAEGPLMGFVPHDPVGQPVRLVLRHG